MQNGILPELQRLFEEEVLSAVDVALARAVRQLIPEEAAADLVALASAFASRAVQAGHVCLELPHLFERPLLGKAGAPLGFMLPELSVWLQALQKSAAVSSSGTRAPLVLDADGRVYLQRYYDYQSRLVRALKARVRGAKDFDDELLKDGLKRLFATGSEVPNLQSAAAVIAVSSPLAVISGGPGTGKTTTVAKILALLAEQAAASSARFHVTLVAPTGKAAQRLSSAIASNVNHLETTESVRAQIQVNASTIHRTLGFQLRTPNQFAHNAQNPLHTDVVLVDEASMVDIALMTKLVEAVPIAARLILLGDKDQLASVEAGAIFGDVFNSDADHRYSLALSERVATLTGNLHLPATEAAQPLADCTIHLSHSYRYDPTSSIAHLANAIRKGDSRAALTELSRGAVDVRWIKTEPGGSKSASAGHSSQASESALKGLRELETVIREEYAEFAEAKGPLEKLAAFARFRILSPHRAGRLGVLGLNELAERVLGDKLNVRQYPHYPGRPILISANDYQLDLFNGDIGVIDVAPSGAGLLAYFETSKGLRSIHPSRLPAHETVFAMTVHKSQGSEFERVAIVLPDQSSPILTRELLYTGLTRARERVIVHGTEDVIRSGIAAQVQRASGLRSGLWSH